MIQHRRAQLMQPRERQLQFRLHARGPRYQAPRGPPDQVVKQRGLAHAGLTAYHQGPALTGPHVSDEPVKYGPFAEPARKPCGLPAAVAWPGMSAHTASQPLITNARPSA